MDQSIICTTSSQRRRRACRLTSRALLCSPSSNPLWLIIINCLSFFCFFSFLSFPTFFTPCFGQETQSDLFTIYNTSCGGDPVQDSSSFISNRATLKNLLVQNASSYLYSLTRTSYFSEDLQGFYQCRGDLTLDLCSSCVTTVVSTSQMNDCSSTNSFRADAGGCSFLYMSAGNNLTSNSFTYLWSSQNTSSVSISGFGPSLDMLLTNLTSVVSSTSTETNFSFAISNSSLGSNASIYALVQCFGILDKSQCSQCLSSITASAVLGTMVNATEGKIYYGGCFARFSSSPFYSEVAAVPPALNSSPSTSNTSTLPLGLGLGLGSLLIIAALLVYWRHWVKKRKQASGSGTKDGLEEGFRVFSIEELRRATQNFHQGNVLGKGGFGHVYKGILDNGETVAVKKLTLISDQAETQFIAEVKFITSVQHRNLIRLHGYCVDSTERILVYEFLPNQSLDKHIFSGDMSVRRMLNWRKRLDILMGLARGLAYMHHDCHQRIIHRDIKAANILLDESLNPKIADFGLARLFGTDKSHVDTGIAGTLGYLAPEYFLHGQLTEKADVYSFGIVMLEVVTGRKVIDNNVDEAENLLQWAWSHFKSETVSELVDVALGKEYEIEEVTQVVSLALSCTQELFSARPNMNNVVAILGNYNQYMPNELSGQPAFIRRTESSMNSWSSTSDDSKPPSSYKTSSEEMSIMLLPHFKH